MVSLPKQLCLGNNGAGEKKQQVLVGPSMALWQNLHIWGKALCFTCPHKGGGVGSIANPAPALGIMSFPSRVSLPAWERRFRGRAGALLAPQERRRGSSSGPHLSDSIHSASWGPSLSLE